MSLLGSRSIAHPFLEPAGAWGRRASNASPSSIAMMDAEPVNPDRGSSSGRMIAAFKGQIERTVSRLVSRSKYSRTG